MIASATPKPVMVSDKIQSRHCDRLAVVYVRQSTLQQIERHQESTRLQYALVDRALALGWMRERTLVIDDDLGRSAASVEGRPGFQRLVAEVGLGRVGLVLGIEMSRLARSCRDWHQLLEICALFDTLIADGDGVYDPSTYNDRLLLGLKGTMSEAELHILKARMQEGRQAKAARGELFFNLPRGYVRRPSGEVALDPDAQVQATIRLVFDVFERRRSLNGVLGYLVDHDIRLPHRTRSGPGKGELEWHRPNRYTLKDLLHNPIYAGAYAYGRRSVDRRRQQPGRPASGRVTKHVTDWPVLLKDRLPAYIAWRQYERNLEQLTANRAQHAGTPRGGPSLLAGLVSCGRCGHRMSAQYRSNGFELRYSCARRAVNYGEARCQSLTGKALDGLIERLVLDALEPAAIEVSLQLAEDVELERAERQRQWAQRLERAGYEVERARRQYSAVDPENRLVARSLERVWEEALAAELKLRAEHERVLARQPAKLTAAEREAIRRLSADIPALWRAPTTTQAERQAIVRLMLERVVVTVEGESEHVLVECHWAGGCRTRSELIRPVKRLDQLSRYPELLARVQVLHAEGHCAAAIARRLNDEGWRPPKRRDSFTAAMARSLLHRAGVVSSPRRSPSSVAQRQDAAEMTIAELSARLGMPDQTLYRWLRRGYLRARLAHAAGHSIWMIHTDEAEIARLRALRQTSSQARPSSPSVRPKHS